MFSEFEYAHDQFEGSEFSLVFYVKEPAEAKNPVASFRECNLKSIREKETTRQKVQWQKAGSRVVFEAIHSDSSWQPFGCQVLVDPIDWVGCTTSEGRTSARCD